MEVTIIGIYSKYKFFLIVEARKLEHDHPHALKEKIRDASTHPPKAMFQLSGIRCIMATYIKSLNKNLVGGGHGAKALAKSVMLSGGFRDWYIEGLGFRV